VGRIRRDSPAAKAGLTVGDVITSVDGKPVRDVRAVRNSIGLVRLGQRLELGVIRNGKQISISVTVEELQSINPLLNGVEFAQQQMQNGRIVVIIESVEPGSRLDRLGLQAGDFILSVNREAVGSVDDLERLSLNQATLLLLVQRGRGVPSLSVSFFQNGARLFNASIKNRQASKAAARCADHTTVNTIGSPG